MPADPIAGANRPGLVFNGWNIDWHGAGAWFTADTIVTGNTTVYSMWTEPPTGPVVYAGVSGKDKAQPNSEVEFTVWLKEAQRVQMVELTFEVEDKMLTGKSYTGLSGFTMFGELKWTQKGDKWEGKAMFIYPGQTGFTAAAQTDIAKLVFTAKDNGAATFKVTDLKVSGVWNQSMADFEVILDPDAGTTVVGNKYDLDKSGRVDMTDFAIVLYYFGAMVGDDIWDKVTPNTLLDVNGNPIFAKECDFNGDGIVDIDDLSDIFLYIQYMQ
jgi:hypothetical protein